MLEATMAKLEEMESSLDRVCSSNSNDLLLPHENNIVTGIGNNDEGAKTLQVDSNSKAVIPSMEVKNVEYERESKRSKLSSRR